MAETIIDPPANNKIDGKIVSLFIYIFINITYWTIYFVSNLSLSEIGNLMQSLQKSNFLF